LHAKKAEYSVHCQQPLPKGHRTLRHKDTHEDTFMVFFSRAPSSLPDFSILIHALTRTFHP